MSGQLDLGRRKFLFGLGGAAVLGAATVACGSDSGSSSGGGGAMSASERLTFNAADGSAYPEQSVPSYSLSSVDQFDPYPAPDIVPGADQFRYANARRLASDALVYGAPAAFEYAQMYRYAVDSSSALYVGFNKFAHDRELAGPGYAAFKTPNVDTLYSNAWLDLSQGPVEVEIPAFGDDRYFTVNFFDMYSNATNISSRTVGGEAGRFLVCTTDWEGDVSNGVQKFTVSTQYQWILMRIFTDGSPQDLDRARALQDQVLLKPSADPSDAPFTPASPDTVQTDWVEFYRSIDTVLRTNGHPDQDDALLFQLRTINIGDPDRPFEPESLDEPTRRALADSFTEGLAMLKASQGQIGIKLDDTGWNTAWAGNYGFDYLIRATTNFVGLGGNVRDEYTNFTAFIDGTGAPLDGRNTYSVTFDSAPPVDAFWSLTVYDAQTRELFPNPANKYAVGDRTQNLATGPNGSITITMGQQPPATNVENWIPTPPGAFYLLLRCYEPRTPLVDREWAPGPVVVQ